MEIKRFLDLWNLTADGDLINRAGSILLPVHFNNTPAMLKVALVKEEILGGKLMVWWQGEGAARVIKHNGPALLLERAKDPGLLSIMAEDDDDDNASRNICKVALKLHKARQVRIPTIIPLRYWFQDLFEISGKYGGILDLAANVADQLLNEGGEVHVLHGDLHHGNVLNFEEKGWLAIDPKGLLGSRGFDYANLFCNPSPKVALKKGRLLRQVAIVSETAKLERNELLKWILAYSGLSASWSLQEGEKPGLQLAIATIAAAEIRLC